MSTFNLKKLFSYTAVLSTLLPGSAIANQPPRGAVYTMTNATNANKVLVYNRDAQGRLGAPQRYDTGGKGTGTSLGNQNALVLDQANRCLYAVNAGSNQISSFLVKADGLLLADKINSGGSRPVSVSVNRNLLYVLNAGGTVGNSDNISGFIVDKNCKMLPLADSTRPLSAANTAPAQVQFTPDGQQLIVTEKSTNKISTYSVLPSGRVTGPRVFVSAGTTPFGFAFGKRDQLLVSEAAAGAANGGTVSSYLVKPNGDLQLITSSLATTETATCWVVVSNDGRFAYVTNTGSESISGLRVSFGGNLSLLTAGGRTGLTGSGTTPIDLSLSNDGLNLYSLDNTRGTVAVFRVNLVTGQLVKLQTIAGLPAGANGIAAR